jgi:hypothetical protein
MTVKDPTIIIEINGELVIAIGEPENIHIQSTNKEYVKTAKHNMEHVTNVPLYAAMPYKQFPTGKTTYLEIIASIVAINYGQAIIVDAPDEVKEALKEIAGESIPGVIY